jgi:hypothetical protein
MPYSYINFYISNAHYLKPYCIHAHRSTTCRSFFFPLIVNFYKWGKIVVFRIHPKNGSMWQFHGADLMIGYISR